LARRAGIAICGPLMCLRVTLLIAGALASLCMEVPSRSCRPARVRSTRMDFIRTAAASSLSLFAQGSAVAIAEEEQRDPALLALDQLRAA
jgi:hypothetical protein